MHSLLTDDGKVVTDVSLSDDPAVYTDLHCRLI